ncbi:hypothetical protein K239x_54990 [Planctomycetes bacterium K23_9]|uniref:Uncharacterized protein n=1 Tax=Stieleria marina TaxID=1930275 RepID=A0A517P284_9BACT|nr:hypothetical protein K239x_54990 [Planctomycetes bacterium K23_9]
MNKHLLDRLQGKPSVVRWVAAVVWIWPVYAVRCALIGIVAGLWVYHGPSSFALVWSRATHMESRPNKKRTPEKSRIGNRLDDFNDVRVRVSELTQ